MKLLFTGGFVNFEVMKAFVITDGARDFEAPADELDDLIVERIELLAVLVHGCTIAKVDTLTIIFYYNWRSRLMLWLFFFFVPGETIGRNYVRNGLASETTVADV